MPQQLKTLQSKKTLARKISAVEKSISHWHGKAEVALEKGRDDLAKAALTQKHKYQAEQEQLNEEDNQLTEFLTAVQDDAQRLQEKLNEAKRRQDALLLRQESAEVRLKVREKAAVYNIEEAIGKFERYQQKIDRIEAQVEAFDMTENKDLSAQISELEQDDNIELELAQMKKQAANG